MTISPYVIVVGEICLFVYLYVHVQKRYLKKQDKGDGNTSAMIAETNSQIICFYCHLIDLRITLY